MHDFNYRNQLVKIYAQLHAFTQGLYAYSFQLALEGELSCMNEVLEDGDELPADLNYLKSLNDPAIHAFVQMIEETAKLQASLININILEGEEAAAAEPLQETEEEAGEEDEEDTLTQIQVFIYSQCLSVYLSLWQLAQEDLQISAQAYKDFDALYFEGKTAIASSDSNVLLLHSFLIQLLEANRQIAYWQRR